MVDEIVKFVKNNRSDVVSLFYSFKGEENFFYHDSWKDEMAKTFMGMTPQDKPLSYIDGKEIICFKMSCTLETWNRLIEQLNTKELKFSFVSNSLKEITFNEIHHYEVSKGNAIRERMKQLNINENNIIVAGDDNNHLSMFKEFYHNSYIVAQEHNTKIKNKAKNIIEKLSDIKID